MSTLLDLTAEIVSAHASTTQMTSEELLQEIQKVHAALQALESGKEVPGPAGDEPRLALTIKQAFKKDEVICLVCGKGGMKTLTRHLRTAHNMKPGQYRKQFGIQNSQPLTAKSFSESRKKMAEERGLGDLLAKARETRMAKLKGNKAVPTKKATPAKRTVTAKINKIAKTTVAKKSN